MTAIHARESYVNATEGYRYGDSDKPHYRAASGVRP